MKLIQKMMVLVLLCTLAGCVQKEKSLYDEVMDIHDEVMPKMGDLYKRKKSLQDSISRHPDMDAEVRAEIESTIATLDSASTSMMVWMREFNPPEQKPDKEAFNKYMESELVKVKKMREDVMKALKKVEKQN